VSGNFRSAFLAHEVAEANHIKSCVEIWRAFRNDEPESATRILNFGGGEVATAIWFYSTTLSKLQSAAQRLITL
jgi:hypothetical protein